MLDQPRSVALPSMLCTEFLQLLLQHNNVTKTLIISSSRENFLDELQACIRITHPQSLSAEQFEDPRPSLHPLLVPSIHLISTSKSINLVFVPTLHHLRAYLAAFVPDRKAGSAKTPILAAWGLMRLHRSTSEHSAQGISRSLAALVEAADIGGQRLVVAEPREIDDGYGDHPSTESPSNPWREEVPLLNGSIRSGGDDGIWAGRTVETGRIVAKWCTFVQVESETIGT